MKPTRTLLIVEDDDQEREKYKGFAESIGFKVTTASSLGQALSFLATHPVDFLLTDIHLTKKNSQAEGLSLFKFVKDEYPSTTAIAMSSDPNLAIFEKATQLGALHYLRKPLQNADELIIAFDLALERRHSQEEGRRKGGVHVLPKSIQEKCPYGIVISDDHIKLINRAAKNPELPAVVYGETGTGKEEIAKLIHRFRKDEEGNIPMVALNCANLSEDLLESALFGHKKGSFSGASETTTGYVGEANGGILFLDEVHTLSLKCQQKLLRVLNDGTYQRVGDTKTLHSSFQVIAASTKDLDDAVDDGAFLLDLRTRLLGVELRLKPLRERLEEIPTFISLFFAKAGVTIVEEEFDKLCEKCKQFFWRGNVRQLIMVLNVLVASAKETEKGIEADNMPIFKTMYSADQNKSVELPLNSSFEKIFSIDAPLPDILESFEKVYLEKALRRHGNIDKAARALELTKSSLESKLRKFSIAMS